MLRTLVWEETEESAEPSEGRAGSAPGRNGQTATGQFHELPDLSLVKQYTGSGTHLLWLDLTAPTPDELQRVAEEFSLHPLAVEDAGKGNQRPKIDEYDSFYFLVTFAVLEQPEVPNQPGVFDATSRFTITEVDLFIGEHFLITVHREPLPILETLGERWRYNSKAINEGIGVLVYTLLDTLVDAYFPVLDAIVEEVEEAEEILFTGDERTGQNYDIRGLFQVKRDLLHLRRVVAPQRDSLLVLTRQQVRLFDRRVAVYFQDVYDHVVRVTDQIDVYQDLLTNTLESYLSLVNNNLNQVMKTLTSLTVILVLPTLIAGIYGMNFDNMPELHWQYGYAYALALMALAASICFLIFRRKGWI